MRKKDSEMNNILRRNSKTVIPDLIDCFEEPFLTLRPYLGQAIRVEDYHLFRVSQWSLAALGAVAHPVTHRPAERLAELALI